MGWGGTYSRQEARMQEGAQDTATAGAAGREGEEIPCFSVLLPSRFPQMLPTVGQRPRGPASVVKRMSASGPQRKGRRVQEGQRRVLSRLLTAV